MKVRKAVIPAAGLGTRMLPLTKYIPKELLPIGKLPMMQYAIEEAAAAGVEEIYIITNKNRKKLIEDYFSNESWQISSIYNSEEGERNVRRCHLVFLEQEKLMGVADAIYLSKRYIGTDPFFVLMPDNVFLGREPSIVQLLRYFMEYNENILALIEVKKEEANLYSNSGKVEVKLLKENLYSIGRLMDKGPLTLHEAPMIRYCGRYILGPEFFYEGEKIQRDVGGELDDVPILQELVKRKSVLGVILQGKLFDCGHWEGYWAANQYWNENRGKWN